MKRGSIDDDQVGIIPTRYTLESVLGSVPPVADDDDLEERIREAKEERAERLMAELEP